MKMALEGLNFSEFHSKEIRNDNANNSRRRKTQQLNHEMYEGLYKIDGIKTRDGLVWVLGRSRDEEHFVGSEPILSVDTLHERLYDLYTGITIYDKETEETLILDIFHPIWLISTM